MNKQIMKGYFLQFISSIDFIGVLMIPFFTDWGGLLGREYMALQSIFFASAALAEVPTGLLGDIKGRKWSVQMASVLFVVGILVYTFQPNFWLFALGEAILGVAVAFKSGALEALLYEEVKADLGNAEWGRIENNNSNFRLLGMLVATGISFFLIGRIGLNEMVRLSVISFAVGWLVVTFGFSESKVITERSLAPSYGEVFHGGLRHFKDSLRMRQLLLFYVLATLPGYYFLWVNQPVLQANEFAYSLYPVLRAVWIISQIVMGVIMTRTSNGSAKNLIPFMVIMSISYIVLGVFIHQPWAILMMYVVIGGISPKIMVVMSPILNSGIRDEERATSLSFVSMAYRIISIFLNPLIGILMEEHLRSLLALLGLIGILSVLYLLRTRK